MKIDTAVIAWLETKLSSTEYGDVGLIFHIKNSAVEWTEKIHRVTERNKNGNNS